MSYGQFSHKNNIGNDIKLISFPVNVTEYVQCYFTDVPPLLFLFGKCDACKIILVVLYSGLMLLCSLKIDANQIAP